MHPVVKERAFVVVSIYELPAAILYGLIELAFVDVSLGVPYSLPFPKVVLELSLIDLVGVNLSPLEILSAIQELADVLDGICL